MRSNPHWGGVSCGDQGQCIGDVLTEYMLECLTRREGICVLYTHLGKVCNTGTPFGTSTVAAFRRLADYFHGGKVLVTTTRRLLQYCRAVREIEFSTQRYGDALCIAVNTKTSRNWLYSSPSLDLSGLTFYVRGAEVLHLNVDGYDATTLKLNVPDHTGQASVSFPWHPLEYPKV